MVVFSIILSIFSLLFIAMGLMFRRMKGIEMVSGYYKGQIINPEGLARYIGNCFIFIGSIGLVISTVLFFVPALMLAYLYALIIVIYTVKLIIGIQDFAAVGKID